MSVLPLVCVHSISEGEDSHWRVTPGLIAALLEAPERGARTAEAKVHGNTWLCLCLHMSPATLN